MTKRAHRLMSSMAACLLPLLAYGQSVSPPSDYPDPHCPRPEVKLIKPGYTGKSNIEDSGLAGAYNQKVKTYNREAQDYDSCMHAYIDGANAELKRVQNDANAQIRLISDTANARLRLIEGKVAAAIQDANQVAQDENLKHK